MDQENLIGLKKSFSLFFSLFFFWQNRIRSSKASRIISRVVTQFCLVLAFLSATGICSKVFPIRFLQQTLRTFCSCCQNGVLQGRCHCTYKLVWNHVVPRWQVCSISILVHQRGKSLSFQLKGKYPNTCSSVEIRIQRHLSCGFVLCTMDLCLACAYYQFLNAFTTVFALRSSLAENRDTLTKARETRTTMKGPPPGNNLALHCAALFVWNEISGWIILRCLLQQRWRLLFQSKSAFKVADVISTTQKKETKLKIWPFGAWVPMFNLWNICIGRV